jgi:hypothetical protein
VARSRAARDRDHHRGQAEPAAAVHSEPVAGSHPSACDDGSIGGREPATKTGCDVETEPVRKRYRVDIGDIDHDVLGERAPVGEARLLLVIADLVLPSPAAGAVAAGTHERRGDALADVPAPYLRADLDDLASELVPRDVRQDDVRIVPRPGMPVAPAQAGCGDPDDGAVGRADGIGNLVYLRQFTEPLEQNCAHRCIASTSRTVPGV